MAKVLRCGDCKNFLNQSNNSAAEDGYCMSQIQDDGLGLEVSVYAEFPAKCKFFEQIDRLRTDTSEFSWDPSLRTARGFDEV